MMTGFELNPDDRLRYSRQISIPEIGADGQIKINASKVLIIGCGALGSMVAMQLTGAGVGEIGIADFDKIDISNLQRQFFFKTAEAGSLKSEILQGNMSALNPNCKVCRYDFLINKERAMELFESYDFIVDATDNPASKKLIETVCEDIGKPCCIGGVSGFRGQVMTIISGDAKFCELFPDSVDGDFLPCSIGGVVGPAAAMCASVQSAEVIKYICNAGECLRSKVFVFDMFENRYQVFTV